jgi:predicted ATP-dependent serine protease
MNTYETVEPTISTCQTCGLDHIGNLDDCWRCDDFNSVIAAARARESQELETRERQLQAEIVAGTYGPPAIFSSDG